MQTGKIIIINIALFAFMKHQRKLNHLSRSANFQMSQIQNIFTNFSYNQNTPQKYKIFSDAQKSSGQSQNGEKMCSTLIDTGSKLYNLGQHDKGFNKVSGIYI